MMKEQKGAILARKITNVGLHRSGKTCFYLVNMDNKNGKKIAKAKEEAARLSILAKFAKANKIKALGKAPVSSTIQQLKILLAPLRHHKDKKMPMKKGDIVLCLMEWEAQGLLLVDEEAAIVVANTRSELQ